MVPMLVYQAGYIPWNPNISPTFPQRFPPGRSARARCPWPSPASSGSPGQSRPLGPAPYRRSWGKPMDYDRPDVETVQKTMENRHFSWENCGKSPFLIGKPWKITIFHGKTAENHHFQWENSGKIHHFSWENSGKIHHFSWENLGTSPLS